MQTFESKSIAPGIRQIYVPADRFKTAELSISMALPLCANTAGANAAAVYLLSRSCEAYPDYQKLSAKLAQLYGAHIGAQVMKVGEAQVMKLSLTAIHDKFALDDTRISQEGVALLLELLFHPCLEDGQLRAGDVQREKRLLVEHIQSEENEKRIYALRRLEAEMFRGEAYGVNRLGTVEQVEALTPQDVTDAWRDMLEHSQVTVTLVGSADAGCIAAQVKEAFACVERAPIDRIETQFVPCAGDVRRVEEQLDVNQGKLVLGFRVDMKPEDAGTPAMRSTVDMFGGGPYSLLFQNVREKMSLCYYCSAMYVRAKSALLVQCGCENENMETAIQEIGNQLQVLRDGSFQDKDFQASKIGMTDTLRSVSDSPDALEAWYAGQLLDEELKTPEAAADQNEAVSREEIAACANRITLDTIYMLKSTGKGEGDAQ